MRYVIIDRTDPDRPTATATIEYDGHARYDLPPNCELVPFTDSTAHYTPTVPERKRFRRQRPIPTVTIVASD